MVCATAEVANRRPEKAVASVNFIAGALQYVLGERCCFAASRSITFILSTVGASSPIGGDIYRVADPVQTCEAPKWIHKKARHGR
jgi:hypothetical protein